MKTKFIKLNLVLIFIWWLLFKNWNKNTSNLFHI